MIFFVKKKLKDSASVCIKKLHFKMQQDAVLSQGGLHDAAVNFGTYRSLQQHHVVFTVIAISNAFELNNSINHGK